MTLKRHERYHEKVRSQTCTECGMVFRSESYLLAHLLRSHRIFPSVRLVRCVFVILRCLFGQLDFACVLYPLHSNYGHMLVSEGTEGIG